MRRGDWYLWMFNPLGHWRSLSEVICPCLGLDNIVRVVHWPWQEAVTAHSLFVHGHVGILTQLCKRRSRLSVTPLIFRVTLCSLQFLVLSFLRCICSLSSNLLNCRSSQESSLQESESNALLSWCNRMRCVCSIHASMEHSSDSEHSHSPQRLNTSRANYLL